MHIRGHPSRPHRFVAIDEDGGHGYTVLQKNLINGIFYRSLGQGGQGQISLHSHRVDRVKSLYTHQKLFFYIRQA